MVIDTRVSSIETILQVKVHILFLMAIAIMVNSIEVGDMVSVKCAMLTLNMCLKVNGGTMNARVKVHCTCQMVAKRKVIG
jgi:hypothetical protein